MLIVAEVLDDRCLGYLTAYQKPPLQLLFNPLQLLKVFLTGEALRTVKIS